MVGDKAKTKITLCNSERVDALKAGLVPREKMFGVFTPEGFLLATFCSPSSAKTYAAGRRDSHGTLPISPIYVAWSERQTTR